MQGWLYDHGSYNEMKAFFTDLQPQIRLVRLYIYVFLRFDTVTLLGSLSIMNIWRKTDELFSFF